LYVISSLCLETKADLTKEFALLRPTGEILFLAWGIKVCYNVRNAESLFNEARLISYAIYNIALVNITMMNIQYVINIMYIITQAWACETRYVISNNVLGSLLIFPRAGPDIKYLLGFLRTQLSTSVTVFLVFGPKVRQSAQ